MAAEDDRAPADDGIPCMLMRGGTSKGAFFLASDLPPEEDALADLLLRVMGSPDPRQIDGLGGGHPLTSKVAVVSRSATPDADLDYLFLQVVVDRPIVATSQTCGNMLAAVAPFAIERGLIEAGDPETTVRIRLVNTGDIATAAFPTPRGRVSYDGAAVIDGVPGAACAIGLSVTAPPAKPLFPSGAIEERIAGHRATLIAGGMPVVLLDAAELDVTGAESPEELEGRESLADAIEEVRVIAGERMGLGDVRDQTVPKVVLLSPPRAAGTISTRIFIPRRVHTSIGVLMAASVAAAVRIPGTVAASLARPSGDTVVIEHPSGSLAARVRVERDADGGWHATSLSERTARKIFDGRVFPRPRP